ncbi:MAG: phage integrase SAM-like domain-containing protein [Phocaeicola sp.]
MNIKRSIRIAIENRKKDGVPVVENVPIRLQVFFGGKRIDFTTGYRIDAAKWDSAKQRVKNNITNKQKQSASQINSNLAKYETYINEIFQDFEAKGTEPTTELIKEAFADKLNPKVVKKEKKTEKRKEKKSDLFTMFDEFVKECGIQNNWTESTYEKFAAVRNHLTIFKKRLTFEFFDENGLTEYVTYLRDVKQMRNSTIGKQLGFLKWFLRWSLKKGYTKNNAFQTFKPKIKNTPKKVIYLTWEELTKFREFEIPESKQYLARMRDVFLFQCFSGLRYSDVFNLRRSNVKEGYIEITTVKTADSLRIELNKHSKAILDKYKDVAFEGYKVLPVITNQKMNDYLKELAEMAGIDEPVHQTYYRGNERIDEVTPKYALLGTHAGRRTFICNALALGISPQVVMKWTGHSDYKAMKPYIDIADTVKATAMDKFNNL